jgi:putative transposase
MTISEALHRRQCIADAASYPSSLDLGLTADKAIKYDKRKLALEMKGQRKGAEEIERESGLSPQLLHYYVHKAERKNRFGEPLGYRALLNEPPERWTQRRASSSLLASIKPKPYQLTAYFQAHPDLHESMVTAATRGKLPGESKDGPALSTAVLTSLFFNLAEKEGTKAPYFPFNGEQFGREYLRRWIKRVRQKFEADGLIERTRRRATNPWTEFEPLSMGAYYDEVECDGHFIDIDWVIEAPALSGEGTIKIRVSRLWLIPIMERKSTAVLGYSIALGTNYAGSDVARAIRNCLVPWTPRELSTTRLTYKSGECLPSALPELSYMCFNVLNADRAKAHLADYLLGTLERGINCVPCFGPVGSPDVRPLIEGLFELLEEAGFRNVRGRLGSNAKDPKRDDKVEDIFCIDYTLLLDFIDVLVCRYNSLSRDGSTTSRIEALRNAVNREHRIFRRLPKDLREAYLQYDIFDEAVIRRDKKRLVVRWKDARYYSKALDLRPDAVDEPVVVQANSKDPRKIRVSLQRDGSPIGILDIEPRWSKTPHSLSTRTSSKRARKGKSFISMAADIPMAIRAELEARAQGGNRFVRSQFARLVIEQGAVVPPGSGAISPPAVETPAPSAQVILAPIPRRAPAVAEATGAGDKPVAPSARRRRIAELGSAHKQK